MSKYLTKAKPKRTDPKPPKRITAWTLAQRDLAQAARFERMYEVRDIDLTNRIASIVAETLVDMGVARFRDEDDDETPPPEALPGAEPPRSLN